jgi:hypothetical protein
MAADREAHVYNTRASDAAYHTIEEATLLQGMSPFEVRR